MRPDHRPPGALLVHCANAMGLGPVVIPDAETEAAADSIAAISA